MIKHAFLLRTPKIRERSPRWLTGVNTKVIRYMLGPTYHGVGGYSKLINGLRAAASGAFVC